MRANSENETMMGSEGRKKASSAKVLLQGKKHFGRGVALTDSGPVPCYVEKKRNRNSKWFKKKSSKTQGKGKRKRKASGK